MRDQHFANDRFDETSMGTDVYMIRLMGSGRDSARRRFNLRKFVGMVVHGVATYASGFYAGQHAAYLAERYYAMNDAQLARIGLTRDQIPAELRRVTAGS